ncbi:MAG TPA: translocation/assembly module TamB domain-containing protein, partial [Cyclobacteriaceae bacterium]|nr:translocation/assembly module TamB domain-containing protein [Cyclobacteriaceae bacterium]
NYFVDASVENDITIDSLTINDFLVGNVNGKNEWDSRKHQFNVNFFIDRNLSRIINLTGSYTPSLDDPLDLTAQLEKANLQLLEPVLQDIFSEMDGTVTGSFKINGTLDDPQINGEGLVTNGQILVNYTKTLYKVSGVVGLKPRTIDFRDLEITDAFKNKGKLTGTINHHVFNQMAIDVRANFKNFQVLNTTAKDNSLFYGQAFATGDVRFFGPVQKLNISSNARTEKNTRLYIPVGGSGNTEQEEYINFVNFNNTVQVEKQTNQKKKNRMDLTGITFDLNLDVTPDAYCEIIFDLKAGDIIRGRGNGDIKLLLDTKGEFNMFGAVEFTEGWYNFTLYNIINKEFEIKKGSRITWYGDPYGAILNIDAAYNQLASLAPLVTIQDAESNTELKRKYPIEVILTLEGQMLSPDINFDILAPDLPQNVLVNGVRLDFIFSSFKARLDEQELKKQVFSLIVLRKFSPLESGFNTSGTLYNSVSELLSNQLSNWMSQVDENLEIDVDLGTMDQEAFNAFQLRLSYTFLNGRLRVTRDGTFGNQNYASTANQNSVASLAGDWTVDYFLTPDGKFKVKMYNRTNYNQLSTSLNNQSYFTTGVSLQHVQSFNEFKDLIKFARKEKKEPEKSEEEKPKEQSLNQEALKNEDDEGL